MSVLPGASYFLAQKGRDKSLISREQEEEDRAGTARSGDLSPRAQKILGGARSACFISTDETVNHRGTPRAGVAGVARPARDRTGVPAGTGHPASRRLPEVCGGRRPPGMGLGRRLPGGADAATEFAGGTGAPGTGVAGQLSAAEGDGGRSVRVESTALAAGGGEAPAAETRACVSGGRVSAVSPTGSLRSRS